MFSSFFLFDKKILRHQKTIMGLLNISFPWQLQAQEETAIISGRECSKKHAPAKAGVRPARPQPF
jgi:hypothetical protein